MPVFPKRPRSIPYDLYVFRGELGEESRLEPLSPAAVKDAMKRFPDALPTANGYGVQSTLADGTIFEVQVVTGHESGEGGPLTTVVIRTGLETGRDGFELAGKVARHLAVRLEALIFDPQAQCRLGATGRTSSWNEALTVFEAQRATFGALLPYSSEVEIHEDKPSLIRRLWRKLWG